MYKKKNIKDAKPGEILERFDFYGYPLVFIFKGIKTVGFNRNEPGVDCYCYSDIRERSVEFIEKDYHFGYLTDDFYVPSEEQINQFMDVLKENQYKWNPETLELSRTKREVKYNVDGNNISISGLSSKQMKNVLKLIKSYK